MIEIKKFWESGFSFTCLYGQVENSFDNSAKYVLPEGWRVSAQGPKMSQKRGFFSKRIPSNWPYGYVECSFGTTAHKVLLEDKKFVAQSPKMLQKVDKKIVSINSSPDT